MRLSHDPFDIWSIERFGELKSRWYSGDKLALVPLSLIYATELLAPNLLRRLFKVPQSEFAHTLAILKSTQFGMDDRAFVWKVQELVSAGGWGLGFKWYSKNGVYPEKTPYITNTPYVMDALVRIHAASPVKQQAQALFNSTWNFLESLRVMYDDGDMCSLSYSPEKEHYIVVNSNSYAAWAYAMHACYGEPCNREFARLRVRKIVNWIVRQQYSDGRWYYLAERGDSDLIDCFHSCFIVRNLLFVGDLLPELEEVIQQVVSIGWAYIKANFQDSSTGLVRRYTEVSRPDLFKYDLYDQAEFLGLLIEFNEIERAVAFSEVVRARFFRDGEWYCRVDRLGRLWGRGFLRWGIAPMVANLCRLDEITREKRRCI